MAESQVFYRKWRPQKFADLVGQDHVKRTIINALKTGRLSHAYLFAGPRGTGKTSMARLLAKAANCTDEKSIKEQGEPCGQCNNCKALRAGSMIDLVEIDAASHTSVDDVRDLIEKVNLTPSIGKYKVYIIDEVHMLSKSAFNALLKTLEEPPEHVIFVLATTEVHKLLPTIISRCQYFDFHHFSKDEIVTQLNKITKSEKVAITPEAVSMVAESAEGSMRDALSILDQVASLGTDKIDRAEVEQLLGVVDVSVLRKLTSAVMRGNTNEGIKIVNDAYYKGYDINQLGKRWLSYLRELLMVKLGNDVLVDRSQDEKLAMSSLVESVSVGEIINLLQRVVDALNRYRVANAPQLALEMIVVSCAKAESSSNPPKQSASEPKPKAKSSPQPVDKDNPKPIKNEAASVDLGDDFWPKLCELLSKTNPALAALLKNSQAKVGKGEIIIEAPSQFLKETISKPSNLNAVVAAAEKLGASNLSVTCVVSERKGAADEVAGVFDIM